MTLAVVFRHAARHEFDEAALWYEERRPGLGTQLAKLAQFLIFRNALRDLVT